MIPYTSNPARSRYTRAMDHLHLVEPPVQLLPLPSWMVDPAAPPTALAQIRQANELALFDTMFENSLEKLSCGEDLATIFSEDPRTPNIARFLRWVMKDEKRKERYYEAQTVGAEMVSQQMIRIADASDTFEDVQRSTLKINTRWRLLGVWNRKRFGEVKQIDQTVTIDMVGAMEAARARADQRSSLIVDVQPKELS